MTTLADVAAAAGVSKAAASLVLSGKFEGRVSERKAERVRVAADELGYVRDAIAGGMRNGRTQTIGVIGERVLSTPYAVSMIDSVLSTSQDLGWSVLLTDAGRDGVAAEEAVRELAALSDRPIVLHGGTGLSRADFAALSGSWNRSTVVMGRSSSAWTCWSARAKASAVG